MAIIAKLIAACLAVLGFLLGWEFLSGFLSWSNGWMEGASYALAALLLCLIARLLWLGRTGSPLFWDCVALAVWIPAAWLARWTLWLVGAASEIGPVPVQAPLLFGTGALILFVAGAVLARQAWKRGRLW